eukprot:3236160-Pyramimonas_sp.AAC.1
MKAAMQFKIIYVNKLADSSGWFSVIQLISLERNVASDRLNRRNRNAKLDEKRAPAREAEQEDELKIYNDRLSHSRFQPRGG